MKTVKKKAEEIYNEVFFKYNIVKKISQEDIEKLEKGIELNPNFIEMYMLLAEIYIEREEFDNAIAIYERALEHNPESAIVHWIKRYFKSDYRLFSLQFRKAQALFEKQNALRTG